VIEMTQALDAKVAWITGAGRGAGRAIAEGLASCGVRLVLQARTESEVFEVRDKLRAAGADVEVVIGSVTDPAAVETVMQTVDDRWGALDILVNNAGISPVLHRSERVTDDEWTAVIDTNLTGLFYCTRAAGRKMIEQGGGSIVNVSSVHGTVGQPRLAAYSASKGGIELLTKTLAVEWAPWGVRVNAVAPGYLETRMTEGLRSSGRHAEAIESRIPMGRFGLPQEIVGAVAFLCSDSASYVTGATLAVDGGWTAQ
jgi:NAD(P)-dependent dehydrogenase (short-subunit alcohol dehydrogenase family)